MSRPLSLAAAIVVGGLASACLGTTTVAEQQAAPPAVEPAPSYAVSDDEVSQYAKAATHVVLIHHSAEQAMQRTGGDEMTERIKTLETIEMAKAVLGEGLSLERFNAITLGLKGDADLRQRVVAELQRLFAEPAPDEDATPDNGI